MQYLLSTLALMQVKYQIVTFVKQHQVGNN